MTFSPAESLFRNVRVNDMKIEIVKKPIMPVDLHPPPQVPCACNNIKPDLPNSLDSTTTAMKPHLLNMIAAHRPEAKQLLVRKGDELVQVQGNLRHG